MAPDALIVQTTRGAVVELESRVNAVVVDRGGRVSEAFGTVDRRLPLRSTAKPVQALALVESGAADALEVSAIELTLASASHNGEDGHVAAVEGWLARLGLSESELQCGASLPYSRAVADDYVAHGGIPRRIRHNCSGKHTGFLALGAQLGADPARYLDREGPVQRAVLAIVAERCGMALDDDDIVGDGCGAPCPCVTLEAVARGWATLMDDTGSSTRIRSAIAAHPWYLAGTGRFDTALVEVTAGRVLSKIGADGMHLAMAPDLGLVVATKAVDGSRIAAEEGLVHLLVQSGALSSDEAERLPRATVRDDAGRVVGAIAVRG
ncbi:MAG TPA: asparaginase [Pseudolysinimonas sp.]|nr:asparaginase [Pseudolysinimonas sp.]